MHNRSAAALGVLPSAMTGFTETQADPTCTGTILAGDAFDLLRFLPDATVDLVLTSPPYWGLRGYGHEHNEAVLAAWQDTGCDDSRIPPYEWYRDAGGVLGREPYPAWYVAHLVELFNRSRRVLKESSSIWINLGDTYFARWSSIRNEGRQGLRTERERRRTPSGGYLHDKQLLMIPARFAIAMQDAGWILRNDLIWAKPTVMPRPEKDRLRLSHEHWFHFVLKRKAGRPAYYYDLAGAEESSLDVVSCPTEPGSDGHSATFPGRLVRPRIASSSPPGGTVLDPFCGTGRTIVESLSLGRSGVGFELYEPWAQAAARTVSSSGYAADRTLATRRASRRPTLRSVSGDNEV